MANVVAISNPKACTKTSYCDSGLRCRDKPVCQNSEILLEPCVYGSDNKVCKAGDAFLNGACTAEAECRADSSAEEICAISYPCTNTTSCEDKHGVLNGCGEMPAFYEGNNTVERGLLAIMAYAIVHQWSMILTRPINAAAIVICTANNGSIHAQAMKTRKNTKKRIMYVIVIIAIKILNMM